MARSASASILPPAFSLEQTLEFTIDPFDQFGCLVFQPLGEDLLLEWSMLNGKWRAPRDWNARVCLGSECEELIVSTTRLPIPRDQRGPQGVVLRLRAISGTC